MTAPKEYCQSLNLNNIYKKTTNKEPNIAKNEFFLISSAIVGHTLEDPIIPTDLSSAPFLNSSNVKLFGSLFFNASNILVSISSSTSVPSTSTL